MENGAQVGVSKLPRAKPKKCVPYSQGKHFVALGPRMLGTFWEHFGVKWASDGALMGPWTYMDTKMKAQVHKIANLGAIWSQLGPF